MINIIELNNENYDLSPITQQLFAHSYLTPFPPQTGFIARDVNAKHFEVKDDFIPRVMHGAMHASRVTAYVKIIHLFRLDYADPAINELTSFAKTVNLTLTQIIHLTQIAALFHDVARKDEGVDYWDAESAHHCLQFLQTEINTLPNNVSQLIANSIAYKDNKEGFVNAAMAIGFTHEDAMIADYLRALVHDADCLDVMRVRKTFKMQFLDMVNAHGLQNVTHHIADLVKDVRQLISLQGDQYFDCVIKLHDEQFGEGTLNFIMERKRDYELADNVYNKITQDMKRFPRLSRIARPLENQTEKGAIYYPFNTTLANDIKQAFLSATLIKEQFELSCPSQRDYLFISFQQPVTTSFMSLDNPTEDDVIAVLFVGEVELTKHCNTLLKPLGGEVELGFRFCGTYNDAKHVDISGFSLKIIYPGNKMDWRETFFDILFREFENTELITKQPGYKEHILSLLSSQSESTRSLSLNKSCFFKQKPLQAINASQLEAVKTYIVKHIPSISAKYIRPNEIGINPVYQHCDTINQPLELNQKKIWLLRSDLILAVGNKNANWTKFNDTELPDAIDTTLHAHVNWEDRYGHTSLAIPHPGYDGSALYGGYLAQRDGFIEIYTFSGRYYRQDLDDKNKAIIEAYVAYQFQNSYGDQPVVFMDAIAVGPNAVLDNFELSMFIGNEPLPHYCIRRPYNRGIIQIVFDNIVEFGQSHMQKDACALSK